MKLSEETSRQRVFALTGGNFSGYYRFKKRFYGLADIPTIFQEKNDRTLKYCTPAWLDDIIVVTRGNKQDNEKKLFDVLNKLEKAGYRASKKKSEFFMNETKWLGHEINENGIKPNEEKVEAIIKLKAPENTKDLKSFLGAIQYMEKFLPKLSEQTDRLRKLLKKKEPWTWGPEQETDFSRIKQMLTGGPCLAHYAKDKDNMVTTDASMDDQIVVPVDLRRRLLDILHFGHAGTTKMITEAKIFWWPDINRDIEIKVKDCIACIASGKNLKYQLPKNHYGKL